MIFSNYNQIATSQARRKLLTLINKAWRSVQPKYFIPQAVKLRSGKLRVENKSFLLGRKRIFVIGAGKVAAEMAWEIERILGVERITAGMVITKKAGVHLKKIKVHLANHPLPSSRGWKGAQTIFNLKKKYAIGKDDLIIALISGGGSALMPHPVAGVSLKDKKKLYDLFIKYGVSGFESTIVKTKISNVKGGGLAKHFYPTPVISLILSDDNGQSGHEFTSSGPLTNHPSTVADALGVIDKYNMRGEAPKSIITYLEKNKKNKITRPTVHVNQFILASNRSLVEAISRLARKEGWLVKTKFDVAGEASEVAREFCGQIVKDKLKKPTLLVCGGETTVQLPKKHGLGGRNQEFVAVALHYLKNRTTSRPWALASVATDGVDYIPQSAGGIIGSDSYAALEKSKINLTKIFKTHNSHYLLKNINANIAVLNSTGTNVGDLMLYLQL